MADAPTTPQNVTNARPRAGRADRAACADCEYAPCRLMCFVGNSLAAWITLWNVQAKSVNGVGRVSTLRIDITSPASGLIARMPHNTGLQWSLFDHVREGDVIAEYDDGE